jgi:CBS domain-containing protein
MRKVSSIIERKGSTILHVSPDTPTLDALKMMAEKNVGSIIVMENNKYLGMMTERDYARKIVLFGKTSMGTKIADVMSTDHPPITMDDTVEHCMELMSEKGIRYLPVFEKNKLIGIISITDLVKETIREQKDTIKHLENYIHNT